MLFYRQIYQILHESQDSQFCWDSHYYDWNKKKLYWVSLKCHIDRRIIEHAAFLIWLKKEPLIQDIEAIWSVRELFVDVNERLKFRCFVKVYWGPFVSLESLMKELKNQHEARITRKDVISNRKYEFTQILFEILYVQKSN